MSSISYNQVTLIGRLGSDPETRYTKDGDPVTTFRIATSRWDRKTTDWHTIVTFKKRAAACGKALSKGSLVQVVGELQNNDFTDRDGVKRYGYNVVATEVLFLSTTKKGEDDNADGGRDGESVDTAPAPPKQAEAQTEDDGDVPF